MTTATITPNAPTVKPVAIVYECAPKGGKVARVTVTRTGRASAYECNCPAFTLWGTCQHTQAVQAEREAQGRQ